MKRFVANLAVAVLLSTFALPLAIALQNSGIPGCCRPTGKHHCSQMPTGSGFKSKTNACPYASQFLATHLTTPQPPQFELYAPHSVGAIDPTFAPSFHRIPGRKVFDRGPPPLPPEKV
jgi:hypothetical protein